MVSVRIRSCIDVPLPEEIVAETIDKAKDYTLMLGVAMRDKTPSFRDYVSVAPFVLLPTCFPKKEFVRAVEIQKTFNFLMHKVSYDHEFLSANLIRTVEADSFMAELFKIYSTVHSKGFAQRISLGLFRSDYMLNADNNMKIAQIEFNMMSTSFGGLARRVTEYHRYILNELGHSDKVENLPENSSDTGLASGLVSAWSMQNDKTAVILFVVESFTYNICDQRAIELEVRRLDPRIQVLRKTFEDLLREKTHLGPKKELITGGHVVSVVYYRTGYQSEDYSGPEDWSLRLLIERSRAIKCPSIQYQLAGSKKIQQALAQPKVLEKFLNEDEAAKIREVFTGLYSLDFDAQGNKAAEMGIANPKRYVLKPQREGGGNNFYDEEVGKVLKSMENDKDREGYILMDRINPPLHKNYFIKPGQPDQGMLRNLVTELGIYGIIIGDETEIYVNRQVGHVLRSKSSSSNEGGIMAGAGGLDSPYLVA